MRKALLIGMSALFAAAVSAQSTAPALKLPRVSQHASLTQTIGNTDMTITYSRPGVKGRKIWGALVPYGQVWRTGANEATTISFSDAVTINGQPLPAGTYSLHTIPGADQWTLIFNKTANQWGSFKYDQAQDALRVTAKPEKGPFTEWLTFDVPQLSTDKATVALRWENLVVPFVVDTNTTAKVMSAATTAVGAAAATDWQTPFRAANFAFDAGNYEQAAAWNDQALKANENMNTLWMKARIAQRRGQLADAVRYGEMALAKKTDKDSAELAAEIRSEVDSWKK
jgi:Protein of unknown function (DUF2911)